ncbi:IclR family transcriptional regulator domain-containing protein [Rhodococcus sp. T7]|uniref:IclR family transcriptional regulator domain-containing protein n=1 Tax=Rhodococcus sp. T7 TaxID=627444 RepID=UPI0013595DC1|nr:IclR family transcriptional regulator C-terminal domain-containing protein [Rhodococcus sp. T7]
MPPQSLFLHATSVGKLSATYDEQLRRRLFSQARPHLTERTLTEPEELEAELEQIRQQGYATSREEANPAWSELRFHFAPTASSPRYTSPPTAHR